jgi:NAD(P)-dependent dehydrogenase (short-subunit alcohol dehydrogenase family)
VCMPQLSAERKGSLVRALRNRTASRRPRTKPTVIEGGPRDGYRLHRLGNMGQGMARNLLKAGHRVVAYNRTRGKAEALAADGAATADTPGQACRGEAVITMLADDHAVEGSSSPAPLHR